MALRLGLPLAAVFALVARPSLGFAGKGSPSFRPLRACTIRHYDEDSYHDAGSSTASLKAQFDLALVLQRSGDQDGALEAYDMFIQAAGQFDIDPRLFAEVHVNIGAIHARRKDRALARHHFEEAVRHREVGTARVNLALIALAEGSKAVRQPGAPPLPPPQQQQQQQQQQQPQLVSLQSIREAKEHCLKAIEADSDANSVTTARRILADVEDMLDGEEEDDGTNAGGGGAAFAM